MRRLAEMQVLQCLRLYFYECVLALWLFHCSKLLSLRGFKNIIFEFTSHSAFRLKKQFIPTGSFLFFLFEGDDIHSTSTSSITNLVVTECQQFEW